MSSYQAKLLSAPGKWFGRLSIAYLVALPATYVCLVRMPLPADIHLARFGDVLAQGAFNLLEGGGATRASANRIEVTGSTPSVPLLLAYHWHEALRCRPDCRVERAQIDIDRVGFIRVPAPHPSDLIIWNSYEGW